MVNVGIVNKEKRRSSWIGVWNQNVNKPCWEAEIGHCIVVTTIPIVAFPQTALPFTQKELCLHVLPLFSVVPLEHLLVF